MAASARFPFDGDHRELALGASKSRRLLPGCARIFQTPKTRSLAAKSDPAG